MCILYMVRTLPGAHGMVPTDLVYILQDARNHDHLWWVAGLGHIVYMRKAYM